MSLMEPRKADPAFLLPEGNKLKDYSHGLEALAVARNDSGNSSSNGDDDDDDNNDDYESTTSEKEESRPVADSDEFDFFDYMKVKVKQIRQFSGNVVNNEKVQMFIVVLIGINAVMMGIGTFSFVSDNDRINHIFESIDEFFLICFTIELCLQFIYHGLRLFLDAWLVFDFVIIFVSFVFSDFQIIRAFRIFRALRLVTRVKVMKNLVLAVFSVMPRMAAISLLLFLIFYIFAVMMTQLFKDLYRDGHTEYDYFGRLDKTFFTLFQIMTLDAWGDIARAVISEFKWAWIPFVVFVTISGFIFYNLIIAVICEAISALGEDVKAKIHGTYEEEDMNSGNTSPDHIREQIETLEEQVDELQRNQEQALHTLTYLTNKLKQKNDTSNKVSPKKSG